MQVVQRPLVVREAGSGMDGSGDLLAPVETGFPIEVKTRAEKKVYLSGQKEEQSLHERNRRKMSVNAVCTTS